MMPLDKLQPMFDVLADVASERIRQFERWGEQDHPSIAPVLVNDPDVRAEFYGILTESHAKRQCERRFAAGGGSFADIAIEEVAEAIAALDDDAREVELIQCAAVFVAWAETIRRRNGGAFAPVHGAPRPLPPGAAAADPLRERSVVVYGPQACGKTRNAQAIRRHFGLHAIVDDAVSGRPVPKEGALILTNDRQLFDKLTGLRRYTFDAVAELVGLAVSA